MKRIVLCEGKTDAILISYFLERRFNWSYLPDHPMKLPVANARNEELNWYRHLQRAGLGQELAIWGVGSVSQIPVKLNVVMENNQRNPRPEDRFEYVVLFFDHDDPTEACLNTVRNWIAGAGLALTDELQLGEWMNAEIDLLGVTPPGRYQLRLLTIVLPPGGLGALETFLIDCWQQFSDADNQLAQAARAFIEGLPELPKQTYLNHRRLPDKACLGAILSVFSPDGLFQKIDPKLKNVPWEQIEDALAVYGRLEAL
jgi:hypothetical protein